MTNIDFKVEEWVVQESLGRIVRGDEAVHLKPKVMRLLVYMAEHAGQVLSKDNLLSVIWEGVHVSDNVVMHAISELRRAFRDDAKNPRFIDTISKKGYRLIAPVDPLVRGEQRRARALNGPRRLAVLPFVSLCQDSVHRFVADALTDMVITAVTQSELVRVVSRTSVMRYLGEKRLLLEIVEELEVDYVLEGTVIASGGSVRCMVRLYNAKEVNLWVDVDTIPAADNLAHLWELAQRVTKGTVTRC